MSANNDTATAPTTVDDVLFNDSNAAGDGTSASAPAAAATTLLKTQEATQQEQSNNSNATSLAFFQDADGRPFFPLLYKMRRGDDGTQASSSTTKANKALQAWQRASQHALSTAQSSLTTAHSSLQKGVQKLAQSTLLSSFENDDDKENKERVCTPFGNGTLMEFRESTATYIVKLDSGGMLYTQDAPKQAEPTTKLSAKNKKPKKRAKTVLELNENFLEWEKARHAEVEQECKRLGIPCTDETKQKCFACLKQDATKPPEKKPAAALLTTSTGKPMFPMLYKLRQSGQDLVKENTQQIRSAVKTDTDAPCLLCATKCCAQHSSPAFKRENVTLCLQCVDQVEHHYYATAKMPVDVERETQRLCDLYGRALLLLQYTAQFMLETAKQLEEQTARHNEIAGVGGSSVGLASGILGVAAACTSKCSTSVV